MLEIFIIFSVIYFTCCYLTLKQPTFHIDIRIHILSEYLCTISCTIFQNDNTVFPLCVFLVLVSLTFTFTETPEKIKNVFINFGIKFNSNIKCKQAI